MNRTNILFLFLVASALFLSCGGNTASPLQGEGDTIPMRYAKNITMVRYGDNVVEVKLKNPWGEGLLGSYVLMEGPNSQLSTLNSQFSFCACSFRHFLVILQSVCRNSWQTAPEKIKG